MPSENISTRKIMNEQEIARPAKMVEVAVNALEDIKAKDISVLETQDKPPCSPA